MQICYVCGEQVKALGIGEFYCKLCDLTFHVEKRGCMNHIEGGDLQRMAALVKNEELDNKNK